MIITLKANASELAIERVIAAAARFDDVTAKPYTFEGRKGSAAEVHLLGDTAEVPESAFRHLPEVRRVVRISERYRLIGRHGQKDVQSGFDYNGVHFDDSQLLLFAGLCAVDTREHVDQMMAALQAEGITTTRMGAYKPRTSPYDLHRGLSHRSASLREDCARALQG